MLRVTIHSCARSSKRPGAMTRIKEKLEGERANVELDLLIGDNVDNELEDRAQAILLN